MKKRYMNSTALAMMAGRGIKLTANERRLGRLLRDPEGHTEAAPQNNGNANSDSGATGNQSNNNDGQQFDPASFWDDPAPEKTPVSQKDGSASDESKGAGSPDGLGSAIEGSIAKFVAPEVMTEDAISGIGKGDYKQFNENLTGALRKSMEQSTQTTIQMIGAIVPKLMEKMQAMVESSHTNKDNRNALREAIPSSKNPAVSPIVDSIYDRALIMNKGDKTKAIAMTKAMLKNMAGETGKDVGIAPASSDSDYGSGGAPTTNWLESLMQSG